MTPTTHRRSSTFQLAPSGPPPRHSEIPLLIAPVGLGKPGASYSFSQSNAEICTNDSSRDASGTATGGRASATGITAGGRASTAALDAARPVSLSFGRAFWHDDEAAR